jgi:hypothetical protein
MTNAIRCQVTSLELANGRYAFVGAAPFVKVTVESIDAGVLSATLLLAPNMAEKCPLGSQMDVHLTTVTR